VTAPRQAGDRRNAAAICAPMNGRLAALAVAVDSRRGRLGRLNALR
jgi:hypothetical protein